LGTKPSIRPRSFFFTALYGLSLVDRGVSIGNIDVHYRS